MALFGIGKKKKDEKKALPKEAGALADIVKSVSKAPAKKTKKEAKAPVVISGVKDVILRPRITEKAANLTTGNVYTFDIRQQATKKDVAAAIKALYKVTPLKVHVVNTPAKRVRLRKRRGFGKTTASRKAYVYLKKGEEIQFA